METKFWSENLRGRDYLEDLDVDDRIKYKIRMKWINMAQDRDQWRALVNTVMNLRVPKKGGNFLIMCATVGFSRKTPLRGISQIVDRE
jgi:hypothetical protein